MIKIAFVITCLESPTGGTEKQLLLFLKNLDRGLFSPFLCVIRGSEWVEKEFDACPVYIAGIPSCKRPGAMLRFWRFVQFLRREKIDIVHAFFKDGTRFGVAAGKLAGVRSIVASRRSQGYWMTPFDLKVDAILNRWVTLIIANSMDTRTWQVKFEGFPADRIRVIHNGVDLAEFRDIPPDARRGLRWQLAIPPEAQVIGIVANLRPVKAIDTFIRAAKLVRAELPGAHFVIVGEGELEADLKALAFNLGLAGCTRFLGRRYDIPRILRAFDMGVISSSSESLSNSVVEYMAAGLPVVCTDVGGARECVEDGENGFVVPAGDFHAMADRVTAVFRNGLAAAMGRKSLERAEKCFSLASMIEKHRQLYCELEGMK